MQDTTTPQVEEGQGLTEDQAAQAILAKWQTREEPAAEEPQQEQPEQEAQADPEPQAEAESEPQQEADFELDFAGEKFKVPAALKETFEKIQSKAKELEGGSNRKFQEAAELRKATEAERAAVVQLRKIAEANADLIADHKAITRRMDAIQGIDANSVDVETLTRLTHEFNQLNAAKANIESKYQQSIKEMGEHEKAAIRARQEHAERIVSQRIKGWGPELQKNLADYAVSRGAPPEALSQITEPWMVEILADAHYGRQMREHKSTLDKRVVQTQPTLKPGASAAKPQAAAKAEDAFARLKKSGTVEAAAMAMLAASQVRKR